jgi:acyl-CoA reductase-like NAD-dependent aldehyde dehydrogenase
MLMLKSSLEETTTNQLDTLLSNSNRNYKPTLHYNGNQLFGPVMTIFVYEDAKWEETLELVDSTSEYALTGLF